MSEIISWVGSVNNLYTADSPDSWKGNWLQEMVKIIVKESQNKCRGIKTLKQSIHSLGI